MIEMTLPGYTALASLSKDKQYYHIVRRAHQVDKYIHPATDGGHNCPGGSETACYDRFFPDCRNGCGRGRPEDPPEVLERIDNCVNQCMQDIGNSCREMCNPTPPPPPPPGGEWGPGWGHGWGPGRPGWGGGPWGGTWGEGPPVTI
jgi:hypothetical protein